MKASEWKDSFEILPTPIVALNAMLGGGFPFGIITEIAGPPGVGKSTLALQVLAQAQRLGKKTYYADAERASGFVLFAERIGVDCSKLEYDKQPYAEKLLQNLLDFARDNKGAVIVVDAVGALLGREEAEKTMEERSIGVQSRMIATFCRKLAPIADEQHHIIIMVNHVYTNPTTTAIQSSGGAKLDYAKGLALWLKNAYGKASKRSSDGTKTVEFVEAEIRNKAKYPGAFDGSKTVLEFVQKEGFVGEFVKVPERKKPGRPAKVNE